MNAHDICFCEEIRNISFFFFFFFFFFLLRKTSYLELSFRKDPFFRKETI